MKLPCLADPTIVASPSNASTFKGSAANMSCHVVASPQSLSVKWIKDGMNLSLTGKRILATSQSFHGVTTYALEIRNTQISDAGRYQCVVRNEKGSQISKPATLTFRKLLFFFFFFSVLLLFSFSFFIIKLKMQIT